MQDFSSAMPTCGEQTVDEQIDLLIEREGGYSANPADHGGATRFGITEAVARAQGYAGQMAAFPRVEAVAIYRRLYWLRPGFDAVAARAPELAGELFDTGVNMGPAVAVTFLQRSLTALNRKWQRLSRSGCRWPLRAGDDRCA